MSRERWQELDEKADRGPWDAQHLVALVLDADGIDLADVYGSNGNADFIAAARTAWPAAERECDQLRAEVSLLRADVTILRAGAVPITDEDLDHFESGVEQGREEALAERDQLRAERDRLCEVVLAIRDSGVAHPLILEAIGTASGLLDDEGQQR